MEAQTKTCTTCNIAVPLGDFWPDKRFKNGLARVCGRCRQSALGALKQANLPQRQKSALSWYHANAAQVCEAQRRVYAANVELERARSRTFRQKHPDKRARSVKAWQQSNAETCRLYARRSTAARRALKLRATPAWSNDFLVREAYALAALRTKAFGFAWHVDHAVPLKSKLVCGLHAHTNLQVIPGKENIGKGNRFWPDMPEMQQAA